MATFSAHGAGLANMDGETVTSSKNEDLHANDKKGPDIKTDILSTDEATEVAINNIEEIYTIESDNSPFPEVRANVPNTDDYELPVNTVRMWFLGVVFTMVCWKAISPISFRLG